MVIGSHWCCGTTILFTKHSHISHSTRSTQTENKHCSLQPEVQLSLSCHGTSPQSYQAVTCFYHQNTLLFGALRHPSAALPSPFPASQRASFPLPVHLHPTIKSPLLLQSYLHASSYQQAHAAVTTHSHPLPTSHCTKEKVLECSQVMAIRAC